MSETTAASTGSSPGLLPRATVTVIGGGVSGMTVAHELADRGFRVLLVEAERAPGRDGKDRLTIGGLAASQYDAHERARTFPGQPDERPADLRLVGEHGYRFFPSWYQHLFDTMRRTPIYDEQRQPTRHSTLDNVKPCTTQAATGAAGHPLLAISRLPQHSPLVASRMRDELRAAGFRDTDVLYVAERMALYMSSCAARRADYESISSYDFFVGIDKPGGQPTIAYSPAFDRQLQYSPKVLAAFDAQYGDARTNIDSFVQMALNELSELPKTDGILNGPTSDAWLDHWRTHLEVIGVEFVSGTAQPLTLGTNGKVHAPVQWHRGGATAEQKAAIAASDYVVVATDAVAAERLTRDLPQVGVPRGLDGFTTTAPPAIAPNAASSPSFMPGMGAQRRDPVASPAMTPWDRFQTLTGVQFFFDTLFETVQGRMYFGTSEWGLSSVAQTCYWTDRPNVHRDGYQTIVSVDIGNATRPSSVTGKSFMASSPDEIATEVWRQMCDGLTGSLVDAAGSLPTPRWYAIDRSLVFDGDRMVANNTPYLVPIVNDWDNRPGGEPWKPGAPGDPTPNLEPDVWQAGHGGAWVHFQSLVFAGTYLKTFTRLTTMEAANESGRHAVNAIIDHWVWQRSSGADGRYGDGQQWVAPEGDRGDFHTLPIRQPTPAGDYCYIRDIEYDEVPALDSLRALDRRLHAAGLPHPFVLAGIEGSTAASSQLVALLMGDRNVGGGSSSAAAPSAPFGLPTTPEELLEKLVTYRSWLEERLQAPAGDGTARTATEDQIIDALGLRPLVDWWDRR
jgi:hypothetical protein